MSDAKLATNSTDNLLYVQNCDFQNNQTGANANTYGWTIFGKTRFLSNATGANVNAATAPSTIAAREPDTYKGTIVFTAQTEGGDKALGIPTLSAEVAKSGNDRRLSFKLPDGSDLVYLERAGVQYGIAPARKQ